VVDGFELTEIGTGEATIPLEEARHEVYTELRAFCL
jgi:hypothetical protein